MEQRYWLRRKRASMAMARQAVSAEARLIHFDLAGRYSVKAAGADLRPQSVALSSSSMNDAVYYSQLEAGARFLASQADTDVDRSRHLAMADHYVSLRLSSAQGYSH